MKKRFAKIKAKLVLVRETQNNCPLINTALCVGYCTTGSLLCQESSNPGLLQKVALRLQAQSDEQSYLAGHDALTGLWNKYEWEIQAKRRIALARKENSTVGLLFVDLTNFKAINDRLGHSIGDKLLQNLALLMLVTLRESDIGRSGGDEFVILVDLKPRRDESLTATQRLDEVVVRLSQKFEVFFESLAEFGAAAAIGSCLWQVGMSLNELVDMADENMRVAKAEQHLKHGKHRD